MYGLGGCIVSTCAIVVYRYIYVIYELYSPLVSLLPLETNSGYSSHLDAYSLTMQGCSGVHVISMYI